MKSDLIDITVQMHAETERAVLVSDDGEEDNAIWLPKSQIEVSFHPAPPGTMRGKGVADITLPEWLAKDKGLI